MSIAHPCKLVVFDVDGTLTQHHTPPTEAVRHMLRRLQINHRVLLLSAGSCRRIALQMEGLRPEILGNYGMEYAVDDQEKGYTVQTLHTYTYNKQDLLLRIDDLRRQWGFTDFYGESLIMRENGCVVFPLLGTNAPLPQRLSFDPDHKKRLALYDSVVSAFPDRNVFIGGTSCFDLPPKPHTKLTALQEFCRKEGFSPKEVVVFGDDYKKHGNDEPLYHSPFPFIPVHGYQTVTQAAAFLMPAEITT